MEWIEPLLTDALARERSIARKYTRMTKVPDTDWPDSHQAWLFVGSQHFRVGEACETRDEAEFTCRMLAMALITVIDRAVSSATIVDMLAATRSAQLEQELTPEQWAALNGERNRLLVRPKRLPAR